ncbi:MAG TPA: FkbM family methyltransferase [Chitinophagaceae bacterium]|nr:FkbM family methyltransferase [Chitinophagaceae bacterium]
MFYKLLNAYARRFAFPRRGLKYFLRMAKWLGIENKTYNKRLANNFYMRVRPSDHIQGQLFWYGHYEKELGDLIKKILKPGDVFLDLGANIGYISLLAAKHEPTAKIISFEPVSSIFGKLEENISLNTARNVKAVHSGVGERNEERDIYISDEDNTGMSSFQKPENYSGRIETVKVITIDKWFESSGLSRVDLIKLDVEGSELDAVTGMHDILKNFRPLLIVEINPGTLSQFGVTAADIFNKLGQLSFRGFLVLSTGFLKPITNYETDKTNNVLFIHDDKIEFYNQLFSN